MAVPYRFLGIALYRHTEHGGIRCHTEADNCGERGTQKHCLFDAAITAITRLVGFNGIRSNVIRLAKFVHVRREAYEQAWHITFGI